MNPKHPIDEGLDGGGGGGVLVFTNHLTFSHLFTVIKILAHSLKLARLFIKILLFTPSSPS